MKKLILISFLLAFICFEKSAAQRLKLYKTFGGVVFELDDSVQLSQKQVMLLIYKNQLAYEEMKKARTRATLSSILGFSGGALVAVPIVSAAVGSEPEWTLAAVGGGALIGAFILNRAYKARALYSIDLYNEQLPQKTSRIKPEFYFYGTGAKLIIKF
jgi:hypothetical protein